MKPTPCLLDGPKLMTWVLPYRVPFSDVDHAGIVFFPRLFGWCHLAFEQWFEDATGEPLASIFTRQGYATPVVATDASFKRPMRHGDRIAIDIHAEHVGERSFTLGFRMVGLEDHEERCTVRVTHAVIAFPGFGAIPMPDVLRRALTGPS